MSEPPPHDDRTRTQQDANGPDIAATVAPGPVAPIQLLPIGNNVPGYEILGELGRGGMGVVYQARDLKLKRMVALKMILAGGHAGRDQLSRFRSEAEAVARLQHHGIVQIYEVGEHAGLPYFSLEYCAGGSLSARLDGTPMPALEAAGVVVQLAQAIHHAHNAGVIHRDLKPANVLLDSAVPLPNQETQTRETNAVKVPPRSTLPAARYTPKITDFGLAKQLDSNEGNTATGAIMGTPSYMAPEQASGKSKEVGPAADVYSLGAILYECLTGRPPFKAATGADTIMQVVNEEPVPVRQLNQKVPRDLETICLKCLRKEPGRRYGSAAELAGDLQRFLRSEPVQARPISTSERLWRWGRRHPDLALMLAASVLLVIGTLVSVTVLYIRAEGQRRLAESERVRAETNAETARQAQANAEASAQQAKRDKQRAEQQEARALAEAEKSTRVTQFITGLFEASDPLGLGGFSFYIPKAMGEKLTAQEILRRGADKIETDKQTPPLIRAAILDTIGNVERSMGDYKAAEKHLLAGLKLREESADTNPLDLAQSVFNLAWLRHERGQYGEAERLYRRALDLRVRHDPKNSALIAASQMNLAWLLMEIEEFTESESLLKEVIERRKLVWGENNREVAIARITLAALYLDTQEPNKAITETLAALKVFQEQEGDSNLGQAIGLFQTAVFQSMALKNHTGAEKYLLECLNRAKEGIGEKHPYLCFIYGQLGETLEMQKKPAEAEKWWRLCHDHALIVVGPEHPKMLIPVTSLARLLVDRDKGEEAIPLFDRLLKAHRDRFGDKHPFVGDVLAGYAGLMWELEKTAERDRMWQEAVEIYQAKPGTPRKQYAETLNYLGVMASQKGDMAEAEKKYRAAVEVELKLPKPRAWLLAQYHSNVASSRMNRNLFDAETEKALQAAQKAFDANKDAGTRQVGYSLPLHWCRFHRYHGRHREVAAHARTAAKLSTKSAARSYEVACELARCLTLLEKSRTDTAQDKMHLRAEYTTEALALLQKAVERGYRNAQVLKTSPDWDPLRQEKAFQDLLKQVEQPR